MSEFLVLTTCCVFDFLCKVSMIELDVVEDRLTRARVELSIAQDIVDLLEKRKREALRRMACRD